MASLVYVVIKILILSISGSSSGAVFFAVFYYKQVVPSGTYLPTPEEFPVYSNQIIRVFTPEEYPVVRYSKITGV